MNVAGIVLAGGRSTRMGAPKAALAWRGTTLLQHTTAVLTRAGTAPLIVVVAPGQAPAAADTGVTVVEDPRQGLGPLQGLAAGLAAAAPHAPWAFVAPTDLPFLHEALVAAVLDACADGVDAVVPRAHGRLQRVVAAYRTTLAGRADALVAAGRRDLGALLGELRVAVLGEAELLGDERLRAADPALRGLRDVDTPADYRAALARVPPAARAGSPR